MIKILLLTLAFSWMDIEFHEDDKLRSLFHKKSNLQEVFTRATESYFKGELQAAKQEFLLVSLRAYDENWDFYQRKMISYAFLRLCQLDRDKCPEYLRKLIELDKDQVQQIDTDVFEPPLIHQTLLLRNQLEKDFYLWQPTEDFTTIKYILVNGRIYHNIEGLSIALPLAKQRIVLVYANYQTEVFIGEVSEFLKWKPKGPTLTSKMATMDLKSLPTSTATTSLEDSWWQQNKKQTAFWAVLSSVALYLIYKNNKSSDKGGSVTTISKE